ncbi:hypothetical protein JTB14_026747 [Gonioctena quinquepunctata]|nr:hypothetical protein JTB14_026747 [Gonioctena quinquepunctata]
MIGNAPSFLKNSKRLDIVIRSNTHENFRLKVSCAVLPVITSKLPRIPLNKNSLNIPLEFGLADPEFHIPSDVDILLGADAYYDILLPQIHRLGPELPTLQLTRLGWVIGGHLPPQIIPKQNKVSLFCQDAYESGDSLDKILAKFWEVEELQSSSPYQQTKSLLNKVSFKRMCVLKTYLPSIFFVQTSRKENSPR